MSECQQYQIVVDSMDEDSWEATMTFTNGKQYHYESNDPYSMMESIARDIDTDRRQ